MKPTAALDVYSSGTRLVIQSHPLRDDGLWLVEMDYVIDLGAHRSVCCAVTAYRVLMAYIVTELALPKRHSRTSGEARPCWPGPFPYRFPAP